MNAAIRSASVETLRKWREHPPLFVREAFKATPDPWQDRALEAFAKEQRIAVKANKGPGKSALDAWCAWNFMATRPRPKVAATSVSGANLRDGLWTEMAKWQARGVPLIRHGFTWSAERIWQNDNKETWWMSARTWPESADVNKQAETLAGLHADYILFIVDEAGSVPDAVIAAAEAALATGIECKLLLTGNPNETSGPLYRAFTTERNLWFLVEVTGDPDDPNRSPRVSVQWARQQIAKYGRNHPWVLVNVFGQFPPTASNSLLGVEDVQAASRRVIPRALFMGEPKILGVDVARYGEDCAVIIERQGPVCNEPREFRNLDTMELTGQVVLAIQETTPDAVFVDVTGIGAGVVDRLHELKHNIVFGVEFGGSPTRQEPKLQNKRTEMWWLMAEWVKKRGALPPSPELLGQLSGPRYKVTSDGCIELESKGSMKKRGLQSPDHADALACTFAQHVPSRAMRESSLAAHRRARTSYDVLGSR